LPVLELDDGSHLTESLAIIEYFEDQHPEHAIADRSAAAGTAASAHLSPIVRRSAGSIRSTLTTYRDKSDSRGRALHRPE
jgi:glutathione S-transferase